MRDEYAEEQYFRQSIVGKNDEDNPYINFSRWGGLHCSDKL